MARMVGRRAPCHAPVFVLAHYPRDRIEMRGGTTFLFVTEGFGVALDRAKAAAGPDPGFAPVGVTHSPYPTRIQPRRPLTATFKIQNAPAPPGPGPRR
jgi:hypothetical protein